MFDFSKKTIKFIIGAAAVLVVGVGLACWSGAVECKVESPSTEIGR